MVLKRKMKCFVSPAGDVWPHSRKAFKLFALRVENIRGYTLHFMCRRKPECSRREKSQTPEILPPAWRAFHAVFPFERPLHALGNAAAVAELHPRGARGERTEILSDCPS